MHFLDGRRLPFLSIVFVRKGHGGEFRGGGGLVDVSLVVRFNAARIRDKRGECFFSQEMRKVLNVANFERMI